MSHNQRTIKLSIRSGKNLILGNGFPTKDKNRDKIRVTIIMTTILQPWRSSSLIFPVSTAYKTLISEPISDLHRLTLNYEIIEKTLKMSKTPNPKKLSNTPFPLPPSPLPLPPPFPSPYNNINLLLKYVRFTTLHPWAHGGQPALHKISRN